MRRPWLRFLLTVAGLAACNVTLAQSVLTRGEALSLDVSDERDQLVFNLLGNLWTIGANGGVATLLADTEGAARNPVWSPDSRRIAFESGGFGGIQLLDVDDETRRRVSTETEEARFPAWHPSGERLIYSARRDGSNFDLFEYDLATGLRWQVSAGQGNDLEAAWSPDGRDLAWVRQQDDLWQLVVRPFGQPEVVLKSSRTPLNAPSWRPDGTLLAYFAETEDGFELRMMILSDPPLERTLGSEPGLYPSRISWLGRSTFYYAADERIRRREFDDWSGRIVNFRASLSAPRTAPVFTVADRELAVSTPAERPLVIRTTRMFDGRGQGYRENVDVLVADGLIAEVTTKKDWADIPIIELPATTLVPGLVDTYSRLPPSLSADDGARLLAWGITTVVAQVPGSFDKQAWEGGLTPGPRLLEAVEMGAGMPGDAEPGNGAPYLVIDAARTKPFSADEERVAAWQSAGIPVLATSWLRAGELNTALFLAGDGAARVSAGGLRTRRDPGTRVTLSLATRQLLSGLADWSTKGLDGVYDARQADGYWRQPGGRLRRKLLDDLRRSRAPIAVASAPNGLPAGLATHAELLALADASLSNDQVLAAAGRRAAAMLGLPGQIGEISVGAVADMVLVSGDPLNNLRDLRNVVAVVRNGRFFSLINLLER